MWTSARSSILGLLGGRSIGLVAQVTGNVSKDEERGSQNLCRRSAANLIAMPAGRLVTSAAGLPK
ncbi:MAG: hypothetical protein ABSH28_22025 [Acidobacteriota bacterium]